MRAFLIAIGLLLLTPACAQTPTPTYVQASRVWIAEFATGRVEAAAPIANLPALVHQPTIDISSPGNKTSNAFASGTRYIRVACEVPCLISVSQGAPSSAIMLPAMRPEYFGVQGGDKLAVAAVP